MATVFSCLNPERDISAIDKQRELFEDAQRLFLSGDSAAAARACKQGLKQFPADANLLCLAARANLVLKQVEVSQDCVSEALRLYPDFPLAHDVSGDLQLLAGKPQEALDAYEMALRLGADNSLMRRKIAKAKQMAADAESGPVDARAPRQQMAFAADIHEAERLDKAGESKQAEAIYRKILKADPDHVEASRLLAGIAVAHEQYLEAEVFLKRAVSLAPDYPRAWVDLANVQRQLEKYDDAIKSASRITDMAPDTAESYMVYGSVVGAAGRHEEAIEVYARAIELAPEKAGAMCAMAHHLKTVGRQDEAIAQYRACIAHREDHCEAYWSLANLKTFRFDEAEVAAMHSLLDGERLTDESRAQLHNALGLEYEARGDFARAFENFELCNILQRKKESYDPVDTESTHDRVIELFDSEFLQQPAGDDVQPVPIFIVGLPRSGSTLIEQILASHSLVEGTHELSDLSKVMRAMRQRDRRDNRFPESVAKLTVTEWSHIGAEYLARTAKHRSNAVFFIDKNPNNFVFIGVLKLAIPNARIINARRHPLDSCLGTYKQLFASGQPFSYDITELAEYYLQYQRLMDHWHRVMPGFVLDVQYEDVVADLESQVRRILDFCGLPFEDACLRFHETERAVKTASSEQVRRPIYSTSVNLWRNYEEHLGAMIEIMEPVLQNLPTDSRPSLIS